MICLNCSLGKSINSLIRSYASKYYDANPNPRTYILSLEDGGAHLDHQEPVVESTTTEPAVVCRDITRIDQTIRLLRGELTGMYCGNMHNDVFPL